MPTLSLSASEMDLLLWLLAMQRRKENLMCQTRRYSTVCSYYDIHHSYDQVMHLFYIITVAKIRCAGCVHCERACPRYLLSQAGTKDQQALGFVQTLESPGRS